LGAGQNRRLVSSGNQESQFEMARHMPGLHPLVEQGQGRREQLVNLWILLMLLGEIAHELD
jgi:hypothetical protein